jgi:hypothetical protein
LQGHLCGRPLSCSLGEFDQFVHVVLFRYSTLL